jgi:hypothetical protein
MAIDAESCPAVELEVERPAHGAGHEAKRMAAQVG